MHNFNSSVLLAASLCAVATAQGRTFDGFQTSAPAPSAPSTSDLGGGGDPTALHLDLDTLRTRIGRHGRDLGLQDPDYTLRGLFQQAHGDFMLRRERFNPMVEVRGQLLPESEVQHEQGSFRMWKSDADIELPFMVSTDGYITAGAFFEQRKFQTKAMPQFPNEDLYSAGAKAGFGVFLDDNTLIEALVMPGYWSDFDGGLNHRDVDVPAKALMTYRAAPELFFKIGARYNEVFEKANLLPYLGVSWQPTESFRVDVLLPESIEISVWPSSDFGLLLGTEIQGAEYHVRNSAAQGGQEADVRLQEVLVYTGAMWRFTDYTSLGVRAGIAAAGDYKLTDGTPGNKVNGALETGIFLEVSFGIEF